MCSGVTSRGMIFIHTNYGVELEGVSFEHETEYYC